MNKLKDRFLKSLAYGVTSLGVLFSAGLVCAEPVNLSGTWVLQERKSLSGADYANGVPQQIVVRQSEKQIVIESTAPGEGGKEETKTVTFVFGEPLETRTPSGRKRVAQFHWREDQSSFVLTTRFSLKGKDDELQSMRTGTWRVSEDGATLIILNEEKSAVNASDPGENWSMQGEYALEKPGETYGIRFTDAAKWQDVLAQAKRENKYIFVDAFATWCGPCKEMEQKVYSKKKVGDFFNQRFISVKVQMDKTPGDDARVREWYADAQSLQQQYVKGFPTFLFVAPDGQVVHKGMGSMEPMEFIGLANKSLDPNFQYYTLLKNYRQAQNMTVAQLRVLASQERQLGDKDVAAQVTEQYLKKARAAHLGKEDVAFLRTVYESPKARELAAAYLKGLDEQALLAPENLELIGTFWDDSIGSSHRLFKLFYREAEKINQIRNAANKSGPGMMPSAHMAWFTPPSPTDWVGGYLRRVILREEITNKISREGHPVSPPDWDAIKASLTHKYGKIDWQMMLLDAQIKFYFDAKQWQSYINHFVQKVDRIGPLALSMADNTIAQVMLPHCDDPQILNKAIGWLETLIEKDKDKGEYTNGHMGIYAGLLYKAGRREEAIGILDKMKEKGLLAGMDAGKVALLEKMKTGAKIDATWDIRAFF